ncbi:class I SAM-dependent methyltransferase [Pseudoalteromonas sp. T1lg10]|uniref:class I SAM-dependent methyltransferase n=1 Tax=Pseudoalteromonas sp. T1lg10 TaxID=2077093 RepID=UPI000CF61DBA|nr:class I SAM-dependent methyltransferase [Pseudoalteromonas sp. T1lg10]
MTEWDAYWADGHNDCFPSETAIEVKGYVKGVWKEIFSQQPFPNKNVLDVCCGSGYIGRALEDLEIDLTTCVKGVDAANIPYSGEAPYPISGGVLIEDLPFEENSFDIIVSNFGIEYSDTNQALKELIRVSANKFDWYFLCHSTESVYSKDSLDVIQELHPFLQRVKFSVNPSLEEAKVVAEAARDQLRKGQFGATSDVLKKLVDGCELAVSGKIKLDLVVDYLSECQRYVERMVAQFNAAKECEHALIPSIPNLPFIQEVNIQNLEWRGSIIAKLIQVSGAKI